MKKAMRSDVKKLITASISCFITLVILIISLAWMVSTMNVGTRGARVKAYDEDILYIGNLTMYKFDTDDNRVVAKEFSPYSVDEIMLNKFDTIFVERQKQTAMIVKVPIHKVNANAVSVSFNCEGDLLNGTALADNLSNCVDVRCSFGSVFDSFADPESSDFNDEFYNGAVAFFENTANKLGSFSVTENHYSEGSFVNYSVNGSSTVLNNKSKTITFTVPYNNTLGDSDMVVYFYINYDKHLIDKFISDNFASQSEIIEDVTTVAFEKDFTTIDFIRIENE